MGIEEVRSKHETRLMQLPNVTGVGIGERGGKEVIVVFVKRKVAVSALRQEDMVPGVLEGYETDVQEIGEVMAQS